MGKQLVYQLKQLVPDAREPVSDENEEDDEENEYGSAIVHVCVDVPAHPHSPQQSQYAKVRHNPMKLLLGE